MEIKGNVKIKINAEINLSSAEGKMDNSDTLMATVYIKGGKDVQIPIEELEDYLHNNTDKIETRHREVRRKMLADSLITLKDKGSNSSI